MWWLGLRPSLSRTDTDSGTQRTDARRPRGGARGLGEEAEGQRGTEWQLGAVTGRRAQPRERARCVGAPPCGALHKFINV